MRERVKRMMIAIILGAMLLAGAGCAPAARDTAAGDTQDPEPRSPLPSYTVSAASEAVPAASEVPAAVTLSGREYPADAETVTIRNPDIEELYRKLPGLPGLKTATLKGRLPDTAQLLALKQAYPAVTFVWDFEFCGAAADTLTEAIDLSGTPMEDTQAMEALLPCFYRLETVDMCGCGLSNEEMDALNRRWPDTLFVWEVEIGTAKIRTDATHFMPFQYGLPKKAFTDYSNLRYCTEMVVLDFGHYYVRDLSFLEYMPNLQYLLLGDTTVADLTPLGACTQLRYLELFYNPVGDFWPLTNLSMLEDLNLGHTPCDCHQYMAEPWSFQPLLQMTWLDRLWLPNAGLSKEEQLLLQQALPNTIMTFQSPGSTEQGWRYSRNYYMQRDILGMYYLHN